MRFFLLLGLLLLGIPSSVHAQKQDGTLSLLSWNIRHFGPSKDSAAMAFIARTISPSDIVAIQEVVANPAGAQTIARLADMLNRSSGYQWDYGVSAPTRSPPYKTERYAFLWKTAQFQRCSSPALLHALDTLVDREPYVLCLRQGERKLLVVNYHARTRNDYPEAEIRHLLPALTAQNGHPVLLAGDFNLQESHPVFIPFRDAGFEPALVNTPSTLRRKTPEYPGQTPYLHPLDNIFYPVRFFRKSDAGVIDIVALSGSQEYAWNISDHAPVWVRLEWEL